MVEFMWTIFLTNLFMFAMVILIIGFMFVLRVLLNVWFDTDFFKRIVNWLKNTDEKIKRKKLLKKAETKGMGVLVAEWEDE